MTQTFDETQTQNGHPEPEMEPPPPAESEPVERISSGAAGVKILSILAILFSVLAILGAGLSYVSFRGAKDGQTVEFGELKAKVQQLEEGVAKQQMSSEQVAAQLIALPGDRDRVNQELEKNRIEISTLEKKIQFLETRTQRIEKNTETSQPEILPLIGPVPVPSGTGTAIAEAAPSTVASIAKSTGAVSTVTKSSGGVAVSVSQVLTVNRKFNFVVVNLGIRDGAKIGHELMIERDGKTVGNVRIEKLYENFSAATILKESANDPIKEKDRVRKGAA